MSAKDLMVADCPSRPVTWSHASLTKESRPSYDPLNRWTTASACPPRSRRSPRRRSRSTRWSTAWLSTSGESTSPAWYTLHPTPYTLHPTPYTLHPTSYTLLEGGGWRDSVAFNLWGVNLASMVRPPPYTLHTPHSTFHPTPSTLHTPHSTLHTSRTQLQPRKREICVCI